MHRLVNKPESVEPSRVPFVEFDSEYRLSAYFRPNFPFAGEITNILDYALLYHILHRRFLPIRPDLI
jgi:hypothetical protein